MTSANPASPTHPKTLVIIRHAHRDKPEGHAADNGVSEKGRKQAARVAGFFERRFEGAVPLLLSSPKRRCIETLEPIAEATSAPIQVDPALDEDGDLEGKISDFLSRWRKTGEPLTVISSHGDWIPVFFQEVLGHSIDLDKGGWAEIEWDASGPRLTWLVQSLKFAP